MANSKQSKKTEKKSEVGDKGEENAPVKKKLEKKRRVFLALEANHASQLVTLSRHGHSDAVGRAHPPKAIVIDEEKNGDEFTGHFVLAARAVEYEEQYAALRYICDNPEGPALLELPDGGIKNLPPEAIPAYLAPVKSEKERLQEARIALDEKSDMIMKGAKIQAEIEKASAGKDERINELEETVNELKKMVKDLQK